MKNNNNNNKIQYSLMQIRTSNIEKNSMVLDVSLPHRKKISFLKIKHEDLYFHLIIYNIH